MSDQELRLGGMALANGVLVHGPTAWGCAIRLPDGRLEVEGGYKRYRSSNVTNPLLRGPAKLADGLSVLPDVRRRLPNAKFPFARPRVLTAMLASTAVVQLDRGAGAGSVPPPRAGTCLARCDRSVDRGLLLDGPQPRAPVGEGAGEARPR